MLDETLHEARPNDAGPEGDGSAIDDPSPAAGSLADDVSALFEDGKTYVEAEIAYQKSRAAFAGNQTKSGVVFGAAALAFLHLALIALVVGLVIALAPYLSAFGATALVVGVLMVGSVIFARMAASRFSAIGKAFGDSGDD